MKLAWMTKLPSSHVPVRGEGASTLLHESNFQSPFTTAFSAEQKPAEVRALPNWFNGLRAQVKQWWDTLSQQPMSTPLPFFPDSELLARVETYAESPFEKTLFLLKKHPHQSVITHHWLQALQSQDDLQRDSAMSLLKAFLTYNHPDFDQQLSAHTQTKMVYFAAHLDEGMSARTQLYKALLTQSPKQFLELAVVLKKDFQQLPALGQLQIIRQMVGFRKDVDALLDEEDGKAFKALIKALTIAFYTGQQESLSADLQQHDKIRLGLLKLQPVQEDYRKQVEELERRYRVKLRQLKKRRSQKIAEIEAEKHQRIELIYETLERYLVAEDANLTPSSTR